MTEKPKNGMLFPWVGVPPHKRERRQAPERREVREVTRDNYYSDRYQRLHQHQVKLKINEITEPELLEWVTSQKNIQGYIKGLIRKDMLECCGFAGSAGLPEEGGEADA